MSELSRRRPRISRSDIRFRSYPFLSFSLSLSSGATITRVSRTREIGAGGWAHRAGMRQEFGMRLFVRGFFGRCGGAC
ncbi:hypothetical protein PUN28_015518 [Cardiocondyla obscurior]|uniref:Uncharacterized protein n=1 Tax=Cardiocondyla obscurior TaxID=286306 RepID=A0AAW2ETH3_9HYME